MSHESKMRSFIDGIEGYIDGIETQLDTMNTNLGAMALMLGRKLNAAPSTFNTAAADSNLTLGAVYDYLGKLYKYVQFKDAVTYVAGHTLHAASVDGLAVTNDSAGGSSVAPLICVGIATRVHTEDYYGFMQVSGVVDVVCDGSVAAGESVTTGTDGVADTMADGVEEQVFGTALEADSGSPVVAAVWLKGLV